MQIFNLVCLAVAALANLKSVVAHSHNHHDHDRHRNLADAGQCGTRTLSEEELAQVEAELEAYQEIHGVCNATYCPIRTEQTIVIPTVWHSICTSAGAGCPTESQITNSFSVLNSAFSGTGFQFGRAGTTTTFNSAYYSAGPATSAETAMKSALRQGDESTLNIYSTGIDVVSGILGFATFPNDYATDPIDDGVVVGTQTAPGGTTSPYNEGDTLVHEVGHWLFLYHVFQGGCSGSGDFVDDTPPQQEATSGCPVGQDSCPFGGVDSIENYMDYSDDSCMFRFTAGQIARMTVAWNTYRASGNPLPTSPVAPTAPVAAPTTGPPTPTAQPTLAPTFCFSDQATVTVQHQGPIDMPNLAHGDKVLTANGYQTLFAFGHRDGETMTEFLQVHTNEYPNKPLEITRQHLVFVVGKPHAVPAHSIQPGDILQSSQWEEGVVVKKITTIHRQGLYAPVTTDGTVVVDGVLSSCYIALQSNAGEYVELQGGISTGLSQHFLAHLSMTPVRMVCLGISAELCKSYDSDGLASFARMGFAVARWADTLSFQVQVLLLPWYLLLMGAVYGIECLFGPKVALFISLAIGAGLFLWCGKSRPSTPNRRRKEE